jgi:hypothetical protein
MLPRPRKLILLDMDELLVNFVGPWLEKFMPHISYATEMATQWQGATDLQSHYGIDRDQFRQDLSSLSAEWWRDLPWMTGGQDLLEMARLSGIDWALCTKPSESPNAAAGKMMWAQQVLGNSNRLILCNWKHRLAGPGVVLVDDMTSNVEAFREAGGEAILAGRPWNNAFDPTHCFRDTLSALRVWIENNG